MAESMLAILCHILRGEPVIQERLSKEREGTSRPDEDAGSGTGGASSVTGAGAVGESASASGGSAGTGGGTADDGSSTTARREPQVNQAQLTQVMCPIFFSARLFLPREQLLFLFSTYKVLLNCTQNGATSINSVEKICT